jgi:hypothetical protein
MESDQGDFFSERELVKQDNAAIVKAFQKRLQTVAGFEFVPDPLPMRNSNNAVVYYLFFASQKPVAKKIMQAQGWPRPQARHRREGRGSKELRKNRRERPPRRNDQAAKRLRRKSPRLAGALSVRCHGNGESWFREPKR